MQHNLFKVQDFNLTCRTCLQRKDTALISIFSTDIANMLIHCKFWDVSEHDGCPDKICTDCEQSLKLSYKFKLQCSESQTILAKFLCDSNEENFADSGDSKDGTDNMSHKQVDLEGSKDVNDLISFLDAPLPPPFAFTCEKCSQSFSEENDLNVHQSVHGDDLVCLSCAKKCSNRQMLKRHIKIHMIDKPHVCQDCGKGFAESHALSKHKLHHSGTPRKKNHMCHQCGQGFSEPFYLTVHLRKHTGERPLVCSECGKSFADPRSFKIHQMTHTGEKPYKCHICPKAFSQSVNLTKHIRVHTGERPYVCQNCGKGFTQSSSLEKHYRTHTGEKPFECSKCSRRFSEKGSLVIHTRLHTGEKPYVCGECGRSFSNSSEFGLHTRKHQGIKRNVCHFCGKDFASAANLFAHLRIHTGERPFKCTTCDRQFVEKGALRRHAKVHLKHDNSSKSLPNSFDATSNNGFFSLDGNNREETLTDGSLYADCCF